MLILQCLQVNYAHGQLATWRWPRAVRAEPGKDIFSFDLSDEQIYAAVRDYPVG